MKCVFAQVDSVLPANGRRPARRAENTLRPKERQLNVWVTADQFNCDQELFPLRRDSDHNLPVAPLISDTSAVCDRCLLEWKDRADESPQSSTVEQLRNYI